MAAEIFLKEKANQYDKLKTISLEKEQNLSKMNETLKQELEHETDRNKERLSALDR